MARLREAGANGRFDVGALRELAGEKAFSRGLEYHRDGQVELLSVDKQRVLATVAGSEDYRAELTGQAKDIGGECSCPAFGDLGFCKHLVAVALAANEAGESGGAVSAVERIRRHLLAKSRDELIETIVGIAERDRDLFCELDIAAAMASQDDKALGARLRKAIDDATAIEYYVGYREVRGWAAELEKVLDRIADLSTMGRAPLALELIEHALPRIAEAILSIDDSNGHGAGLMEKAADIHLEACRIVRPDPIALARDVFQRETEDDGDTFWQAVRRYAEVLGDEGLAEYRRLAVEAWQKLPPRTSGKQSTSGFSADHPVLESILDFFAERDGDVEARIAIRSRDLSSAWQYLELARFCLEQRRDEEALRHAEEGLWLFEDNAPDQRLVAFTVDLLVRMSRAADAEVLLWKAFSRSPSLEVYEKLRKHGGQPSCDKAIAFLRAQLAKSHAATRWDAPADLLIRVLMHDEMHNEAWETAHKHGASEWLQEELAKVSEGSHPRDALAVYAKRVDRLVSGGLGYEDAYRMITHMAGLCDASEHAAYVAGLKAKFKLKRNFMKLLNAG